MSYLRNRTLEDTTQTDNSNTSSYDTIDGALRGIAILAIVSIGSTIINGCIPLIGVVFLVVESCIKSKYGVKAELIEIINEAIQSEEENQNEITLVQSNLIDYDNEHIY